MLRKKSISNRYLVDVYTIEVSRSWYKELINPFKREERNRRDWSRHCYNNQLVCTIAQALESERGWGFMFLRQVKRAAKIVSRFAWARMQSRAEIRVRAKKNKARKHPLFPVISDECRNATGRKRMERTRRSYLDNALFSSSHRQQRIARNSR